MGEQKRIEPRANKSSDSSDRVEGSTEITEKGKKLKEDIDTLLAEIDDILEENAEEFVKSYVQRGGQ
jgi:prokaryotic ubiquitin-like protein Pup